MVFKRCATLQPEHVIKTQGQDAKPSGVPVATRRKGIPMGRRKMLKDAPTRQRRKGIIGKRRDLIIDGD